jgi:hypothetical protein
MKSNVICLVLSCAIVASLFLPSFVLGEGEEDTPNVDFPDVPRVAVWEAYEKYKSGRAILIQAGGEVFERRHIKGALASPDPEALHRGDAELPNYPMEGIEIFTYCY